MTKKKEDGAVVFNFPLERIHRPEAVGTGALAKENSDAANEKTKRTIISVMAKNFSAAIVRECAGVGIGVDRVNHMIATGKIPEDIHKPLCLLHLVIEAAICRLDGMNNYLDPLISRLVPDDIDPILVKAEQLNVEENDKLKRAVKRFLTEYSKSPENANKLVENLKKAVEKDGIQKATKRNR